MLSAFVQDGSPGGGAVMEPEAGGSGRSCEWKLEQDLFSHGQTFFFFYLLKPWHQKVVYPQGI